MIKFNGSEFVFESFPNGETKIITDGITESFTGEDWIDFHYENDSDLIKLMFLKKYIDTFKQDVSLRIMYMPYSRMDRVEGMSAFTLKYVAEFINNLNFKDVQVVEPHSDVATALLNNCTATYPTVHLLDFVMDKVDFDRNEDYLFYPDAGSQKRYGKLKGFKELVGYKKRDFDTGKITSLDVVGGADKTRKIIIMDDLCSYGGTFIMSAKKLKEMGFEEIYLLVAHCEESIYKGDIFKTELIDGVFAINSMQKESKNKKLTIFNV